MKSATLFGMARRSMLRAMIGRLSGKIVEKTAEGAVIDTGGVGYDVTLPLSALAALPALGEQTTLWIHTHVREDELKLIGFSSGRDRQAFRELLKVNGVGPKVALAVVGALSSGELARAIDAGDVKRLSAIPGIGKKTAERIVLELGGKLKLGVDEKPEHAPSELAEVGFALRNLGFKPARVDAVVAELGRAGARGAFEELLRLGLARLQDGG
jgi:Holliday junction DNA helicase RuvA